MTMIRVEVKNTEATTKAGTSRAGRQYSFREQRGWLHGIAEYPVEVSWILDGGQAPFAPGFYQLAPRCFSVTRFGECVVRFAYMQPEKKA